MQVEVDLAPQQLLNALAGGDAHLLEAPSALADDDGLLGVALDDEAHAHLEAASGALNAADLALVIGVGNLVDDDGQGVGQLVTHALQGGLAHELGDHDLLGLVGDLTGGVQRRGQGHVLEKDLLKDVDLLVALG